MAWLRAFQRSRRRIGLRALESVYYCDWMIDASLGHLDQTKLDLELKTDLVEMQLRYLSYWAHLHTFGNRAVAEGLLWNKPGPLSDRVIPRWLIRDATAQARRGRVRKRGLTVAAEQAWSGSDFFGQADKHFYAGRGPPYEA